MTVFEVYNLRDDAFPVTPSNQNGTPWFGFADLRAEFRGILERSASENLRLCILNRGRFGAGKTHAARHFSAVCEEARPFGIYSGCISALVESPKQAAKAFSDFTSRLLNALTFHRIVNAARSVRTNSGPEEMHRMLMSVTSSEDIATVLCRLDDRNLLATRTYLLGGGSARELRELGVAKRITTEHEYALALVGVMWLLIHGHSGAAGALSRVILWMDEMEDLVYFPTRYYLPFTQGLRELIDRTGSHLTLFLNFTFSEPEDLPSIETVLGQAIMQRVNTHVIFRQPTEGDIRGYLQELLDHNRLERTSRCGTFPFSASAFGLIIDASVDRTPRFVNKLCDSLLRDMKDSLGLPANDGTLISGEQVRTRLPMLVSSLEEVRG